MSITLTNLYSNLQYKYQDRHAAVLKNRSSEKSNSAPCPSADSGRSQDFDSCFIAKCVSHSLRVPAWHLHSELRTYVMNRIKSNEPRTYPSLGKGTRAHLHCQSSERGPHRPSDPKQDPSGKQTASRAGTFHGSLLRNGGFDIDNLYFATSRRAL